MAISTYSELTTAVANWLARADLTSRIPEAIAMAEAHFNDVIRHRQMEQRATATASEYMALPADYLEMRNIKVQGSPSRKLEPISSFAADYSAESGSTVSYVLHANQIWLVPAPAGTEVIEIDYYKQIPALSATTTTNWLLTQSPDVYLYGACFHALTLVQDDQRVVMCGQYMSSIIDRLTGADKRQRWSGGELRVRSATAVV